MALPCTYEYRVFDNTNNKNIGRHLQTVTEHSHTMKFRTLQLMYDVVWDKQRREAIRIMSIVEHGCDQVRNNSGMHA